MRWRLLGTGLVAALVVTVVALWAAEGAQAPGLVSIAPPEGARLEGQPTAVTLRFTESVDPQESHVAVASDDATVVLAGPSNVDEHVLVQPIAAAGSGTVQIAYHVILRDGSELSGMSWFVLAGSEADHPGDLPTERPAAPSPAESSPGWAGPSEPGTTGGHAHGEVGVVVAGLSLLLMVAGVAGLTMLLRRPPAMRPSR